MENIIYPVVKFMPFAKNIFGQHELVSNSRNKFDNKKVMKNELSSLSSLRVYSYKTRDCRYLNTCYLYAAYIIAIYLVLRMKFIATVV